MSAVAAPADTDRKLVTAQRLVIENVGWAQYEKFLVAIGDRYIRATYDRGTLELMAPLRNHEFVKKYLGRLVDTATLELNWPLASCGSMTCRREDSERGLEPDECYYVENELRVRGNRELDFRHDPPPDLAIEIDVWSSSLDRQGIYAALGVPELWRYDDGIFQICLLNGDAIYTPAGRSRSFPFLTSEIIADWVERYEQDGETAAFRAFRTWIAADVLPNLPSAGDAPPV